MPLTLTADRRHFLRDGKPFFWLGDTAWLLFEKLTPSEALTYLDDRAAKGFTVIQATLVHKPGYANPAGSPALLADDFARPNPDAASDAYWPTVRQIVNAAADRGLMMALLPSWGVFVRNGQLSGEAIDRYTDHLAHYFGECSNVLWLCGGDVRGSDAPGDFDRIGRCLRQKCSGQLIGFHPFGRCDSSMWFQESPWLDFHMFQSGHRRYDQTHMNAWDDRAPTERSFGEDNFRYVWYDRALQPIRPTLDGEPSYEGIPQGLHDPSQPRWQDHDVRRYAYWSLLAGAAGFTYGHNAVMQFQRPGDPGNYGVQETWQEALSAPGSGQMRHLRALMERINWQQGEPAQHLLPENGDRYACNLALRTPHALCVYSHTGQPFPVDASQLPTDWHACWIDPADGTRHPVGTITPVRQRFTPPVKLSGHNDWLLLISQDDPQ